MTIPLHTMLASPRSSLAAAALLTLPYWFSGIAKRADVDGALAGARDFDLEHVGLIGGLMHAAVVRASPR